MMKIYAEYECEGRKHGYPCRVKGRGSVTWHMGNGGEIHSYDLPNNWTVTSGGKTVCLDCVEATVMRKLMDTDLPDPSKDPPILQKNAEAVLKAMRDSDVTAMRDDNPGLKSMKGDEPPHFKGCPGDGNGESIEVRCREGYVELLWDSGVFAKIPCTSDYRVINPPPFLDKTIVEWVRGGLASHREGMPLAPEIQWDDEGLATMDAEHGANTE